VYTRKIQRRVIKVIDKEMDRKYGSRATLLKDDKTSLFFPRPLKMTVHDDEELLVKNGIKQFPA
jgi:hypothetical protein